jgi:hypothetical protein
MLEVLPVSPLAIPYNPDTQQARIAFNVGFGKEATRDGLVLDIDRAELYDALTQGGVEPTDYPIFIEKSNSDGIDGRFVNNDQYAHFIFYTSGGYGKISKSNVVHEAIHGGDYRRDRTSLECNRASRKACASLGALAATPALMYPLVAGHVSEVLSNSTVELSFAGMMAVLGDVALSLSLYTEYRRRKHERRAFKAQQNVHDSNILITTKADAHDGIATGVTTPQQTKQSIGIKARELGRDIKATLRLMFVPDFKN